MTCYDPSGYNLSSLSGTSTPWYPCNYTTADGFVPCCQPSQGECSYNKACSYNRHGTTDVLIRGGCTDPTFKSTSCPQFLLNENYQSNKNYIHNCMNGTGCYNLSASHSDWNCSCEPGAPNLLLIGSTSIVYASAVSSSSAQTNGSSTTAQTSFSGTTTSFMSTARGPENTSMPESTDLEIKIGVPVGVIGGLVLVVAFGLLLWRHRRRQLSMAEKCLLQGKEPGIVFDDEPGIACDDEPGIAVH